MKYFLFLLLVTISTSTLNAECYYSKFHLKFEIESTSAKKFIYYKELSACDFNIDSMYSQDYLIKTLHFGYSSDSLIVFKNRISYKYCIGQKMHCLESEKDSIFKVFDKITLNPKEISSLRVLEHLKVDAFDYLSSSLEISDTIWMKEQPVEVLNCGAYLCYHKILIHEANDQISKILLEIKRLQLEIDRLEKEDGIDAGNGDSYDYKLLSLIDKLPTGKKIVVISGCTD